MPPKHRIETFGNASLQVFVDDRPWLVTDPWLGGQVYFGSWGLNRPPDEREIAHAQASPYAWISHGHPDHLHLPSIARLQPATQKVLLPAHYHDDIPRYFREAGFEVIVLTYRRWHDLGGGIRVQCLEHANQDAILLVEIGGTLLVNGNDCPLYGEIPYLRSLIQRYEHSYLLALCAVEADMVNIVNSSGERLIHRPEELKPGAIWSTVDLCRDLGVDAFCCSSSLHIYCRGDSSWANDYRMTFEDMQRWWTGGREVDLVPPYAAIDLASGEVTELYEDSGPCWDQVQDGTGEDDWDEPLQAGDRKLLDAFFLRFELLPKGLDFLRFTVGGVQHEVVLDNKRRSRKKRRGVHFHVPRHSLLATLQSGYFDDLLVGNFMRTELIHLDSLYPAFTPIVSKLGGMAHVLTARERRRFRWHHLRLSPKAYLRDAWQGYWLRRAKPALRRVFQGLGLLEFFKRLGRKLRGLPPLPKR